MAAFKKQSQMVQYHFPFPVSLGPLFDNIIRRQIQHFTQAVVIREHRLCLRDFAELPVQPLNNVRRVYDFPNLS